MLSKKLSLHWQLPRKLSCCVTIKISFPSKVVKTYQVFFGGNLEQAIKDVCLNESIVDDLKTVELIAAAEAEMKEKQEELDLLQSRLNRSRSSTPPTHHRFATEESPEFSENSRAARMCPQVKWRRSRRLFWSWEVISSLSMRGCLIPLSNRSRRPSRCRSGRL